MNFNNYYKDLFVATTDTVVGLGAKVNPENAQKLFEIKKRSQNKKLIIMIADLEQGNLFPEWNQSIVEYGQKYWPGPVTLITNNLAFRIPDSDKLRQLIREIGPIYMTSANISGEKTLNFAETKKLFFQVKKTYNFGEGTKEPSTIFNVDTKQTIREGKVKVEVI